MHYTQLPRSLVDVPILINIQTLIMSQPIQKRTLVSRFMIEYLNSSPIFKIVLELSLIPTGVDINEDPLATSLVVQHLPLIEIPIFENNDTFPMKLAIFHISYAYFVVPQAKQFE